MDAVTARRQAERSEATREALVLAARDLFAERGFGATATEDIVARASVTRGALYHHFRDKKDLFRAVYTRLGEEKRARMVDAMNTDDLIGGVQAAISTYLEACADPVFTRICHVEAPGVLGWDEWHAIGTEHALGLIHDVVHRAADAGLIATEPSDILAHIVHGAIFEAGMVVSRNPDVDVVQVERTLMQFLLGLIQNDEGGA